MPTTIHSKRSAGRSGSKEHQTRGEKAVIEAQGWFGYSGDPTDAPVDSEILAVYAEGKLPSIITGKCTIGWYFQNENIIVGDIVDIAVCDPMVLRQAKLLAKDLRQLSVEYRQRVPKEFWQRDDLNDFWAWLWDGKIVLVDYRNVTFARNVIPDFQPSPGVTV